jgi:outer membrane protein OmpA-like peptidoglycan-associated protein
MLFADAEIDFSDQSLILPFRTTIDSATATIRDVASFGGTPGSLELEGLVDRDGLARASGSLHVADPFAATDVKMEFRNLDLSHFTPYSAQFAGYAIKSGRLDLDMRYRVLERQLDADHHIVAKDLALGDKVEGGESPGFLVKVAISLMKDKDGRITLDVPVTGSVDDPQFSYRGIVWKAMKQMLGKVATAPFRFLGKLLGIGGDAPELVDFDPGRSDLIPPEREKMDSLAAELGRKPDLVLKIEGRYDSISDAAALREAKLEALLTQRRDSMFAGKKQGDTSSTALGRTLESLYADIFSQPALDSLRDSLKTVVASDTVKRRKPRGGYETPAYFTQLRERMLLRQEVPPDELVQLARARATSIVAALASAGLADSSRMEVLEPSPVKKKKEGSPRISSELAMDAK